MSAPATGPLPHSAPSRWRRGALIRGVLFPAYCRLVDNVGATERFVLEAYRIDEVCGTFTPEEFVQPVEIEPVFGLGPGEAVWSAARVVDHLLAVGQSVAGLLVFLHRNELPPLPVDLVGRKAHGQRGVAVLPDFRAFAAEYPRALPKAPARSDRPVRHAHPLLGPLDFHGWHCFSAIHLWTHRRQLQAIRRALNRAQTGRTLRAVLFDPPPEMEVPR